MIFFVGIRININPAFLSLIAVNISFAKTIAVPLGESNYVNDEFPLLKHHIFFEHS